MTANTDLARAERTFRANFAAPSTAEPTATQVAAVVAVEGVTGTATKQQVGRARLRLTALRGLGEFLPMRYPRGRGRVLNELIISQSGCRAMALPPVGSRGREVAGVIQIPDPTLRGLLSRSERTPGPFRCQ